MKLTGENILSSFSDRIVLRKKVIPFTRRNQGRKISKRGNLCLFCHPRGGSTWLAELMMQIPGSVLIDEPLWRGIQKGPWQKPKKADGKVDAIEGLDFFFHQHIPEFVSWPDAKTVFLEIMTGRVAAKSLYDEQELSRLGNQGLFITKFCYANLLLPWLIRQFDFQAILLTRHPCAVVASQLKHPSWQQLKMTNAQEISDFPFNEIYISAYKKMGRVVSPEMYLAMIWAMGFRETAMHPENNRKWLTISYESLVLHFHKEINRINQRYDYELVAEELDYSRPSKSVIPGEERKIISGNQLDSWQKELSVRQTDDILNVLDIFGINIYGPAPEPDYSRLYQHDDAL